MSTPDERRRRFSLKHLDDGATVNNVIPKQFLISQGKIPQYERMATVVAGPR